jgi:hypothetical protein
VCVRAARATGGRAPGDAELTNGKRRPLLHGVHPG